MNTTKKIVVVLTVMMVAAAMAAPAAMGANPTYEATVLPGQNTVVTVLNQTFGSGNTGDTLNISDSLNLSNTGNADANVAANITAHVGDVYGLKSDWDDIIPGDNLKLGKTGSLMTLNKVVGSVQLGGPNKVPANGYLRYDAQLNIPAGQNATAYRGTVEIILS
ncbi:MAG: hypothetical protein KAT65_20110 [Methanophagales archaeon]|nr:hypothetical protein [Methanophagales archaeon]